ncbi:MAG: M23 family metallopeptidase [Candidatus Aminicenantes bacterium]
MRKFSVFVLCFYLIASALLAVHSERWFSPSGEPINITYRALQPGEIITVSVQDGTRISKVMIQFLEKKYVMGKDDIRSQYLAFLGLDLGLEPGTYNMKIYIQKSDGGWESLEKKIVVQAKEFPVKRLWVKEKYVIPPPEVRERIKRESNILRSIYARFTPQWLGEEKFVIPTSGKVLDNFGERRIYNNKPRSPHGGVDISAPAGNPVKASNSGIVVLSTDLYFAGRTVIIDHGLGLFTIYCHFSKIAVKRGEQVKKGEIIGEVGATGRVTGPHLHWGVKILGSRVDPFSVLDFIL